MRALSLVAAALSVSILTGCASKPELVAGDAGPAGASLETTSAGAAPSTSTSTAVSTSAAVPGTTSTKAPLGSTSGIRATDWANVTFENLRFLNLGNVRFRNGKASSGAINCTMLPGGARPVYAEYLTEEPANSPVTEDALILIECGSDYMDQALVPVKLGFDQKTRETIGFIEADPPTGPNNRMTFVSYKVDGEVIVTTVQKTDGSKEARRYRYGGGIIWERA